VTIEITWEEVATCQAVPALFVGNSAYVYDDSGDKTLNNYFPSGWMGDTGDIKYEDDTNVVHSGSTSAKITYTPKGAQKWAGIYWLPVPTVRDDWGNLVFGIDLTGVKKLTWWAKSEVAAAIVEFYTGGVTNAPCPDSLPKQKKIVTLTTNWQQFEIALASVSTDQLKHVVGGFGWSASKLDNPNGFTIYIDDVKFTK